MLTHGHPVLIIITITLFPLEDGALHFCRKMFWEEGRQESFNPKIKFFSLSSASTHLPSVYSIFVFAVIPELQSNAKIAGFEIWMMLPSPCIWRSQWSANPNPPFVSCVGLSAARPQLLCTGHHHHHHQGQSELCDTEGWSRRYLQKEYDIHVHCVCDYFLHQEAVIKIHNWFDNLQKLSTWI